MIGMKDVEFYTSDDLCKMFKISKVTLYRWVGQKKITGYKVGKVLLFKKTEIAKFIEENRI